MRSGGMAEGNAGIGGDGTIERRDRTPGTWSASRHAAQRSRGGPSARLDHSAAMSINANPSFRIASARRSSSVTTCSDAGRRSAATNAAATRTLHCDRIHGGDQRRPWLDRMLWPAARLPARGQVGLSRTALSARRFSQGAGRALSVPPVDHTRGGLRPVGSSAPTASWPPSPPYKCL